MEIKEPREVRRKEPLPGEYGFPIPRELLYRELGFGGCFAFHNNPRYNAGKKLVTQSLSTKAVHTLCTKELTRRRFKLPNGARTTFHIAFSADGSKVASCHGDHNVYVCDVASGEVIQTLSGHPRTPWCVIFHPSQNDVLASGCLAGQVRVWDLKGGSEVLVTDSGTVIASLAFHPTVRLLAIATFNEIIFWDWSHPYPLARCSTENTKEKVRLVRFDRFGHSLITGITNFPGPPCRDEGRRSTRNGNGLSPFFRPNILSRNFRGRQSSPLFGSNRDEVDAVDDGEGEVVEEVIVPDPEEAEVFAAAADDPLLVRETLNARQDRFQENYRQLVTHYEELVSNYQQFLRNRIPRIYEDNERLNSAPPPSVLQDEPMEAEPEPEPPLPQISNDIEISTIEPQFIEGDALLSGTATPLVVVQSEPLDPDEETETAGVVTTLESPSSPVVLDDATPGPSRLLFESDLTPDSSVEVTLEGDGDTSPEVEASAPTPSTSSNTPSSTTGRSRSSGRSDQSPGPDLNNIETLARNILEMQNLCSRVRMDVPMSIENHHVMELRAIRRHLELLQEQTRDLQSSIRATLNSLATGSMAALRSSSTLGGLNDNVTRSRTRQTSFQSIEQAMPPTPAESGSRNSLNSEHPHPTRSMLEREPAPATSERPVRRIHIDALQRSNPDGLNGRSGDASTLYRIMISTPNRIRVPPMTAMQYEVSEPFPRNSSSASSSSRNIEEPTAGPSRDTTGRISASSARGRVGDDSAASPAPRRAVREFHLVSGRPGSFIAEEHARHCPFGRDPYQWRPPPRMRSLYDMGEMPALDAWPTMETGAATSTRNFRDVRTPPASNRQSRPSISNITITVRSVGCIHNELFGGNINRSSASQFMNFSQWLLSTDINAVTALTSDILVSIYLTIRQSSNNEEDGSLERNSNEQWQNIFGNVVPGLALIPPALRQGQRPTQQHPHRCQSRRRRTHWICYNHNGSALLSHRPYSSALSGSRSNNSNNNTSNSEDQNSNNINSSSSAPVSSANGRLQNRIPLNILEESSSSSSSSSSSGYSSSSSEPVCLTTTTRGKETAQSTSSSSSMTSKSSPSTSSRSQTIPSQLDVNFSRVFYIRTAEEVIPVYSTVSSTESGLGAGSEIRESLQASVYYLPVGLFLPGGPWEHQTIGIHWPPVTREEEYAVLDLRVSERPLSVYETDTRESYPNNRRYPRIRLDYDETSLRVSLPTGFTLQFIQSGLTLLDCISTSINLPRPRPLAGTVWIDYFGPFLDSLERMFGIRHVRRGIAPIPPSHHRVGAFLRRTPQWINENGRPSLTSNDQASPSTSQSAATPGGSSSGNGSPNNNASGQRERLSITPSSSRRAEMGERLRSVTGRRIITLAADAPVENSRRLYGDPSMILGHGYMYDGGNNNGPGSHQQRTSDRRFYFRQRHMHSGGTVSSVNESGGSGLRNRDGPEGSRLIRLAVDTAASEVLRRSHHHHHHHHYHHHHHHLDGDGNNLPIVEAGSASGFSTIGRPVESRIERVLNERGNRGVHPQSSGLLEDSSRNRMRLEEIQLRISMLSQWSRARALATSGTQTPTALSFTRSGWSRTAERERERPSSSLPLELGSSSISSERNRIPGERSNDDNVHRTVLNLSTSRNGTSPNGESQPRFSRRRPYSRIARFVPNETDDNSEDEMLVSVPPRIPRLSDHIPQPQQQSQTDFEGGGGRSRRPDPSTSRQQSTSRVPGPARHPFDQWIMRSVPSALSPIHGYRPQAVVEQSGSARTRAPPQNSRPTASSNTTDANTSVDHSHEAVGNIRPRVRLSRVQPISANGSNDGNNNSVGNDEEPQFDAGARFYPGYIPEILITPRTRPPTYYTMDAATTAFLSSRIQKWDFTEFLIPDITKRDDFVVVRECSLHSDACLDISSDSEFLAVLQPSDSGSYSSVGIYSLRDDCLGELLNVYHFDQNTVSVSISPSCDYLVVGYAGRGPLYRFVHPSRNIGKIISIARDEEEGFKLVHVKDLFADGQVAFMSINCMHWVPVSGYGIIYGTNTGDLVLLS